MKSIFAPTAATFFLTVLLAGNLPAADHVVHMTADWTFLPKSLVIPAGDTVTWVNEDEFFFHDATSTTALFTTGFLDFEESATLSFDTPGSYPYRDSLISSMTGTITVNAAAPPPARAVLIDPAQLANGSFRFTVTNLTVGTTNIIEASTNLLTWTARATNVAASASLNFTNAASGFRFFRSWQRP